MQLLVKAGAKFTTPRPSDLYTPLHIACECNYKDIAKYFIKLGADINCMDRYFTYSFTAIITYFRTYSLTHSLTHQLRLERTPLHVICSIPEDRVDLASFLIKNGADDKKMDIHGWTH